MKKTIATITLATALGLAAAHPVMAKWGQQNHYGAGKQVQAGVERPVLDDETKEKLSQFFEENRELRKQMVVGRAELRAIMRGDNPDADKVAQLSGELFDLRMSMRDKAKEAGLEQYIGRAMAKAHGKGMRRGGPGQGQNSMMEGWPE